MQGSPIRIFKNRERSLRETVANGAGRRHPHVTLFVTPVRPEVMTIGDSRKMPDGRDMLSSCSRNRVVT